MCTSPDACRIAIAATLKTLSTFENNYQPFNTNKSQPFANTLSAILCNKGSSPRLQNQPSSTIAMHLTTFLMAALGSTSVAAHAEVGLLAPHIVQNIKSNARRAAPVLAEGEVAIVALYETGDCTGTPSFLRMQDLKCYGPIPRTSSIQFATAGEHCEGEIEPVLRQYSC